MATYKSIKYNISGADLTGLTASQIPNLDASKITTGTLNNARISLDAAEIPNLDTAKITTGTFANARIGESSVTQHVAATDLQPIKSDITALALREATNEASAAFNLPNQFIDTFSDDTNLGTQTNGDRPTVNDVVQGYWTTVYSYLQAFSDDSNTHALLHMDDTGLTDTAGTFSNPTLSGNAARSSTQSKFGGYSLTLDGSGDYLTYPYHVSQNINTADFTLEFWIRRNTLGDHTIWSGRLADTDRYYFMLKSSQVYLYSRQGSSVVMTATANYTFVVDTWTHVAIVRSSGTGYIFIDGVSKSVSGSMSGVLKSHGAALTVGYQTGHGQYADAYIDELRFSDNARYTSNFTPNSIEVDNATGTLIQSANTVASAKTVVGGTALYKDTTGTASLGTDLKIYFTCNGGTNWTEAASYNAITPVYSSGIKQVRLGETTCTSGTDIRYKAVWANQASGSKVTELHGIGITY